LLAATLAVVHLGLQELAVDPKAVFRSTRKRPCLVEKATLKFAIRGAGRHWQLRYVVNSPLVCVALSLWRHLELAIEAGCFLARANCTVHGALSFQAIFSQSTIILSSCGWCWRDRYNAWIPRGCGQEALARSHRPRDATMGYILTVCYCAKSL